MEGVISSETLENFITLHSVTSKKTQKSNLTTSNLNMDRADFFRAVGNKGLLPKIKIFDYF
jgi:hypothetical protein